MNQISLNNNTLIGKRYQLHEALGSGGMGIVYRATDRETNSAVAIKLLKPQASSSSPDILERFEREAEALRQLNHPNIVKVLATLQEDNLHYIVMEYVPGGSLHELLQARGRLPIKRTVEVALDLADALSRAHRLKIIHRDLKPANVLVAADGSTRLTDFGVARIGARERVTEMGAAIGTPDYMSPEGIDGEEVDARADLWSFGVMLFEMLTGQRPFRGETLTNLVIGILTQPTPDLEALRPDAPIALIDLVYRMLTKDREARIPSARLVGAELEAIQEGGLALGITTTTARVVPASPATPNGSAFATPTPDTHSSLRHNLPAQTSLFLGREAELIELARLIADPGTRLVTILGPGGMGKTRLSLAFAEQIVGTHTATTTQFRAADLFNDGVFFIPLEALSEPDDIVTALADALKYSFISDGRSHHQQIVEYLSERQSLLIFDNFEHILGGVPLLADLLRAAPRLKIIATSRERLNLSSETLFNLDGMDFPEWETPADALDYTAVKLFLQGARRARPGYDIAPDDLPYIARITRLVNGTPLGILLAAAWVETLPPVEIADEISRSLDFLETELRDVPERHRSIRAVFEYSWNLLSDDERDVFMKLSLFRGGFERDAAQAIAGASLRTLTSMVNKSLLRRTPEGRYYVHELLRQYAEVRYIQCCLDAEIRRRHSAFYADWAAQIEPMILSSDERQAIARIDLEHENLRSAIMWMIEDARWDELGKVLHPLTLFLQARSRNAEGIKIYTDILNRLRERGEEGSRLYWRVLVRRANMESGLGDYDTARQESEQALAYFEAQGDHIEAALSLNIIAYVQMMQGMYDTALETCKRAVAHAEQTTSIMVLGFAVGNQGYVEYLRGNLDEAERLYTNQIRQFKSRSAPSYMALATNNLGEILAAKGDFDGAQAYFEDAYATFKAYNNRRGMGFTLNNLGGICSVRGNWHEAKAKFEEGYALNKEIGYKSGIGHSLSALGNVAFYEGDLDGAQRFYEESLALRRRMGDVRSMSDSLSDLGDVALAQMDCAAAERWYQQSLDASRSINDQAGIARGLIWVGIARGMNGASDADVLPYFEEGLRIAEAINSGQHRVAAVLGLGEMYFQSGQFDQAQAYFLQALAMVAHVNIVGMTLFTLVGLASVFAETGQPERAAEIVGIVRQYPRTDFNFMTAMKVQHLQDRLPHMLTPEAYQAALLRGGAADVHVVARALLAELG